MNCLQWKIYIKREKFSGILIYHCVYIFVYSTYCSIYLPIYKKKRIRQHFRNGRIIYSNYDKTLLIFYICVFSKIFLLSISPLRIQTILCSNGKYRPYLVKYKNLISKFMLPYIGACLGSFNFPKYFLCNVFHIHIC